MVQAVKEIEKNKKGEREMTEHKEVSGVVCGTHSEARAEAMVDLGLTDVI